MKPSSMSEETREGARRGGDDWDGRESWGWGAWFGFSCGFPAYDYHPYDYPYDHDPFSASFMLGAAAASHLLQVDPTNAVREDRGAEMNDETFDWSDFLVPTPQPNGG